MCCQRVFQPVTLPLKCSIAHRKINGMDVGDQEFPMLAGNGIAGNQDTLGTRVMGSLSMNEQVKLGAIFEAVSTPASIL